MRVHIEKMLKNHPCTSCGKDTSLYRLCIMKENGLGKSFILCRNCICEISYRLNEICGVEFPFIEKEDDSEMCALYEQKRPHGEWILCSDKLPDKDGDYIVSHLFCGEPEVGKSWFNTKAGFTYGMVYAWMPLPKPCKHKKGQRLFNREEKEGEAE